MLTIILVYDVDVYVALYAGDYKCLSNYVYESVDIYNWKLGCELGLKGNCFF